MLNIYIYMIFIITNKKCLILFCWRSATGNQILGIVGFFTEFWVDRAGFWGWGGVYSWNIFYNDFYHISSIFNMDSSTVMQLP